MPDSVSFREQQGSRDRWQWDQQAKRGSLVDSLEIIQYMLYTDLQGANMKDFYTPNALTLSIF